MPRLNIFDCYDYWERYVCYFVLWGYLFNIYDVPVQLAYCIVQFIEKDATLTEPVSAELSLLSNDPVYANLCCANI